MSNKNGSYYAKLNDCKVRGYRQAQERYDHNKIKLGMDAQTNVAGEIRYTPWLNMPDADGTYRRRYSNVYCATSQEAIDLAQAGREIMYGDT